MKLAFCCEQFPIKTRMSLYYYGVSCAVCDKALYSKDRKYLSQHRLKATLCRTCADRALWRINNLSVTVETPPYSLVSCKSCGVSFKGALRNPKESCENCLRPNTRKTRKARKASVYEFYDASGVLIYVGKTINPESRFISGRTSHKNTKRWFDDIVLVRVTWFRSEYSALCTEAQLIRDKSPKYNQAQPHVYSERKMPSVLTYCAVLQP